MKLAQALALNRVGRKGLSWQKRLKAQSMRATGHSNNCGINERQRGEKRRGENEKVSASGTELA